MTVADGEPKKKFFPISIFGGQVFFWIALLLSFLHFSNHGNEIKQTNFNN